MLDKTDLDINKCKDSFCILPWVHSFINLGGEFQVCCTGDEFGNYILDKDKQKMKVQDGHSIDQVMNSDYMKEFRQKLIQGESLPECTRCFVTEKSGGVSRRNQENDQYSHLIEDVLEKTELDGSISPKIVHADYRLGNICNLKCRMCNPRASKKWVNESSHISTNLLNAAFLKRMDEFKNYDWFEQNEFMIDFESKISWLDRLHFGGGEPLYNRKMLDMLKKCIEVDQAKNITLSYNTNLTILNEEILNLWKKFKEVKLLISIDGFGELNDYIRYPSKWNDIDKNLILLDEKHEEYRISEIIVSTTVQINNILHIDKLFDYLQKFNFVVKCPNLVSLFFPAYLAPSTLPRPLRILAKMKIDSLISNIKKREDIPDYMFKSFLGVASSFLKSDYAEDKYLGDFLQFTREYDKNNNLDVLSVNPELKNFLVK